MNKLLSAEFSRLKKNKLFWAGMAVMFVFGSYAALHSYGSQQRLNIDLPLDNMFFSFTTFLVFAASAVCSLFLGTDYSNGTIRNKLVVGHKRSAIYLTNLIVNTASVLLMCLAYIIGVSAFGIPLLGFFQSDAKSVLTVAGCIVLMDLAFSSLFTLVGMLIQNKASAAVACILGVVVLFFSAIYISSGLSEPKEYQGYSYSDDTGVTETQEAEPNPNYLEGAQRKVYEFLFDFLPTGQSMQLSRINPVNLPELPLYSLIISAVSTAGGLLLFRRINIK